MSNPDSQLNLVVTLTPLADFSETLQVEDLDPSTVSYHFTFHHMRFWVCLTVSPIKPLLRDWDLQNSHPAHDPRRASPHTSTTLLDASGDPHLEINLYNFVKNFCSKIPTQYIYSIGKFNLLQEYARICLRATLTLKWLFNGKLQCVVRVISFHYQQNWGLQLHLFQLQHIRK